MSPNLNSDHHYIVTVSNTWIRKAQMIWEKEQLEAKRKGWKNIFFHEHGWCGKIGEWAVASVFPNITPVTQHFNPTKHDFIGKSQLVHEVKTNSADRPFEESFHFNVNDRQYKENDNDTYIGCYYMPGSPQIRICGWIYKEMVKTRGERTDKGAILSKVKNIKASRGFWKIPYKEMNAMFLFPDHY